MPAVLILEAMAQVGGMLMLNSVDDPSNKLMYFMGIDGAKFRRPVVPGDQLRLQAAAAVGEAPHLKMRGEAFVDGELVAEAGPAGARSWTGERAMSVRIHPGAFVDPEARLGSDVAVGPGAVDRAGRASSATARASTRTRW